MTGFAMKELKTPALKKGDVYTTIPTRTALRWRIVDIKQTDHENYTFFIEKADGSSVEPMSFVYHMHQRLYRIDEFEVGPHVS